MSSDPAGRAASLSHGGESLSGEPERRVAGRVLSSAQLDSGSTVTEWPPVSPRAAVPPAERASGQCGSLKGELLN